MLWLTADTHWGHRNVLKHDKRPFVTIEEHDARIIENWNSLVKDTDDVWHLGDFNVYSDLNAEHYFRQLKGRIHIVWGNHDQETRKKFSHLFESNWDYKELKVNHQLMVLSHYSFRSWRNAHRGSWHLFGHSHHSLPSLGKSLDVGINGHDYRPISFSQIKNYMDKQIAISHHGTED